MFCKILDFRELVFRCVYENSLDQGSGDLFRISCERILGSYFSAGRMSQKRFVWV